MTGASITLFPLLTQGAEPFDTVSGFTKRHAYLNFRVGFLGHTGIPSESNSGSGNSSVFRGFRLMTGSKSAVFYQVAEILRAVKPSIGGKKLILGKIVMLPEIFQDRL